MGNKLGRRRQVVDEKYTRPQGLYQIKDVDHKKLRKLILESKLAPCYPGDEESGYELEECPICFLCYPSLNRSRCCMKSICTECFLQMKTPNSSRPTQCPFCKTSNYAVEYRGVKTKEEKGIEQIEEQRVIEAKIRMRQQEIQDEEERMSKRQEISSSSQDIEAGDIDCNSVAVPSSRFPAETEEIVSSNDSSASPLVSHLPHSRTNRDDDFDLDLEDIMVMEAIWLSIQENGRQRTQRNGNATSCEQIVTEDQYASATMGPLSGSSSSPSGGLACAIAALAERQQMGGESSSNHCENPSSTSSNVLPDTSRFYNTAVQNAEYYPSAESSTDISSRCRMPSPRDDGAWNIDRGSEVAEAGTSYAGSDATEDGCALPQADDTEGSYPTVTGPIVPEGYEEQMMLAMAVSLAEAQALSNAPGVTWQ